MNWKFWKKKVEVPTVIQHSMNINIYYYGVNTITSFSCPCEANADHKDIFKEFYCWYKFAKTDEYEFVYNKGSYLIKRADIRMVHFYKETK